jgi:thiol-disulfide isomerase/thioredoxin
MAVSGRVRMPSLGGATEWLNSEPLGPAELRGRVVLVNFWTWTCINWLRQEPYVRAWSQAYRDNGLVVIGVHTPEFSFEHDIDGVQRATEERAIDYPVAVDNAYEIWRAFANHYGPALYFVDADGVSRDRHFGEGRYEQSEGVIQRLLGVEREPCPSKGSAWRRPPTGTISSRSRPIRAIGDVTGLWPLTHVGTYQARVVAANILGEPREAHYEAVPRVTFTDPQAAAVGAAEDSFSATVRLADVPPTATYTRAESNGYLTVVSDGQRLTGAHALGPEAGEWLQQATLAIRAHIPLDILRDTIQPFPTFSEIYFAALQALHSEIATARVAEVA